MNRILIVGDIHINEKAIPEIEKIFEEILHIDADKFIQLGDYYDYNRPTPLELKFGTNLAKKLKKKFKDVTIISGTGKHDLLHDTSIIEHLKELGINTIKGDYVDKNIYLYSHFMLYESQLQYGTGRCGVKDLAKYGKVFLGHQHLFQELSPGIYHPGSIRYVNFNEVTDSFKRIILLEDGKIKFIKLKSPMPMIDVKSIKELGKIEPGKKKVRLIVSSFEQFKKEVNEFDKYRHKYFEFKVKLDFTQAKKSTNKPIINTQKRNLTDILREGINKVSDKDVRELLQKQLEQIK